MVPIGAHVYIKKKGAHVLKKKIYIGSQDKQVRIYQGKKKDQNCKPTNTYQKQYVR
jgi:hypothetical protein